MPAGDRPAGGEPAQLRLDCLTSLVVAADGAAWMEFTARGKMQRFWNSAGNSVETFTGETEGRAGLEQALCVWV